MTRIPILALLLGTAVLKASVSLAALFIGIIAIITIDSAYLNSKNKRTSNQQNSCGNDEYHLSEY
jgi:hypothetical protein